MGNAHGDSPWGIPGFPIVSGYMPPMEWVAIGGGDLRGLLLHRRCILLRRHCMLLRRQLVAPQALRRAAQALELAALDAAYGCTAIA